MNITRPLLRHLFSDKHFVKCLTKDFNTFEIPELVGELRNYAFDEQTDLPGEMNEFINWMYDEFDFYNNTVEVLSIGWDSNSGSGPGGNGGAFFVMKYGLVCMYSSDYSSDYVEIFDKKKFYPWVIEDLNNDIITLSSDIYNRKELMSFVRAMGCLEHTELQIKGKGEKEAACYYFRNDKFVSIEEDEQQ